MVIEYVLFYMLRISLVAYIFMKWTRDPKMFQRLKENQGELGESYASSFKKSENTIE